MTIDVRSYRVFVEPLVPDLGGGFVSYAPDLLGCVSDGATPDEALHNIYDAIASWIEAARANGEPIPSASKTREYA
ncbi:MAG TPA: type II toxin-antitoxin system HicB family antitoxin [Sphingomicrobium sp.]|jgi:predicted RNase H-like HicB family nuclease|nr:type II toxin-antitoxin system HicB family antitoxin [Sphingomicrobium sp.]